MKARYATNGDNPGRRVSFWCPGCEDAHSVVIDVSDGWTFNGDLNAPTLAPSLLVRMVKWHGDYGNWSRPTHPNVEPGGECICHSFVTDGRIQFLGDSTHMLAGQTVDLPEWPYPSEADA